MMITKSINELSFIDRGGVFIVLAIKKENLQLLIHLT